jgi:mannose-6-phosphate isomerase-like protein (cupin superfamily)
MLNATNTHPNILPSNAQAAIVDPDDGEVLEVRGNRLVIKVASPRQFICDYTAPAGFPGPPLHVHPLFDETFLVLEGQLTVRVGDDVTHLAPGGTAFVPGAVPHTFANTGPEPVRFLLVCSPGGFEDYFRAVAAGDEPAMVAAGDRMGYAPVNGQTPASHATA